MQFSTATTAHERKKMCELRHRVFIEELGHKNASGVVGRLLVDGATAELLYRMRWIANSTWRMALAFARDTRCLQMMVFQAPRECRLPSRRTRDLFEGR